MSKFIRTSLAALIALVGATVFNPGVALASFGPAIVFGMSSSVTVGDTGLPAVIELTNGSDGTEAGYTAIICNQGDNPPCLDPGVAVPDDDIGINLILSCGVYGASTTCSSADPGVFRPSPTGTGRAGTECAGTTFDVVDYNPGYGALRFTPQSGNVTLADPGVGCIIDFTVDVIGYPSIDRVPGLPGQQTGQLGDVTAYSDNVQKLPGEDSDSRDITVARAQPAIVTLASPAVALGEGPITDRATISGRAFPDATANVQFDLYGPNDAECENPPVSTSTVPISSTDTQVTSEPYTPLAVGTYRWVASYLGDSNNNPVAGSCNDANESVVATPGQPTLVTTASSDIRLGGTLTDTATVAGRVGPLAGATVDFRLYGPDDATCAGTPIFESLGLPISTTSDVVTSAAYTPVVPGTYRWVAEYSGDANNVGDAGACNDSNESTDVGPAQPEITTDAGDDIAPGGSLSDKATVTGRVSPLASTVDFRLYGPDDAACSGTPAFEALGVALPVADTMVTSPSFTPTIAGTYRWIAAYSGDANNAPATGECGDPAETVDVLQGTPQITTQASPGIEVGSGAIFDEATVTGRVLPQAGATIEFRLYGAGDTACSGNPIFESRVDYPVAGGTVRSASFTPTAAGTYRWIATYSGDANNASATGECGDSAETVEVVLNPDVELPATGSETDILLRTGGGLLVAGLALFGLGGRRRRPSMQS